MPRACRSTPPPPSACWSAHEHAAVRRRRAVHGPRGTVDGRSPTQLPLRAEVPPRSSFPDGFAPYAWAATVAEVAARHGLAPAEVLKFDQNTPALPGVAQIPLAESFATLNAYPDGTYRDLREAAASYVSRESGAEVAWDQIVVGAGADDLILLCARTYLAPGRTASIVPPTYALYRIATMLAGADPILGADGADGASLIWRCNPDNPTGAVTPAAELVELARRHPDAAVVVDEAYVEYGGETVVPWLGECPNLVVLRTMSKAFGYAALRVGYAVAAPATAAVLDARRAPAPISAPAARIAAAALRDPRYDLATELAERERVRDALVAAGFDAPPVAGNFVWIRSDGRSRRAPRAAGHHRPPVRGGDPGHPPAADRERPLPAGPRSRARPAARARGHAHPHEHRDGAPHHALARRQRPVARRDRDRVSRPPAHAARLPRRVRSRLRRGRRPRGRRAPHRRGRSRRVRERRPAGARDAGGDRALRLRRRADGRGPRDGGGRPRPASARRDLARLQRASGSAGSRSRCSRTRSSGSRWRPVARSTSKSTGADDHHVAEAAFKALGQALRQAVAAGDGGIRSTKGIA